MSKQIESIAIFVDFDINSKTGREYIEHASVQIRDENFKLIINAGLSSVVKSESDLWEQVRRTVENIVSEGYDIDNPEVSLYRSHKSSLNLEYFEAIGQHI
jgi:hypothetical protein